MTTDKFLQATRFIDYNHPTVAAWARSVARSDSSDRDRAVSLYYAVRDGIRYDPYTIDLTVQGMRASTTLGAGRGWCIPKATLLAAGCRALGIPTRLGFADVRNHLTTERLNKLMKTDIFYWHGYASICIDGRWLKATPAFNIELCARMHLKPLEFDGCSDSIYHPFDERGNAHMEYVRYRGDYPDLPLDAIIDTLQRHYGSFANLPPSDFSADVKAENPDVRNGSAE